VNAIKHAMAVGGIKVNTEPVVVAVGFVGSPVGVALDGRLRAGPDPFTFVLKVSSANPYVV